MKLSIVATLYQSEKYIDEFLARTHSAAESMVGSDYEVVLVNDGSPDQSLYKAIEAAESNPNIVVVDLSRNFGHHKAMMTGLMHALGDRILLIDSDLEECPEWLLEFSRIQSKKQCDVVYGVQAQRKGSLFEKITGDWFYILFDMLSGLKLPRNAVTARLMSRRYVDALVKHLDNEVFLAGLWHITGFDQVPCSVRKTSTSITTYTFRKKLSVFVNSLTSFSNAPLKAIFYIGAAISVISAVYIAYLLSMKLLVSKPLDGWTSIMASIWLLGGMIISILGIIGIYLSKIFSEAKNRPYTIVRHIYGQKR